MFFIISISCVFLANKIHQKSILESSIVTIPKFSFTTQTNHEYTNKNIDNAKKRIIINYFSPTCDHCESMAVSFIKDSLLIKNVQIIMITTAKDTEIEKFYRHHNLSLMSNIIILKDTKLLFHKIFGTAIVPTFFIYENEKLVKKIIGETKIENLLN